RGRLVQFSTIARFSSGAKIRFRVRLPAASGSDDGFIRAHRFSRPLYDHVCTSCFASSPSPVVTLTMARITRLTASYVSTGSFFSVGGKISGFRSRHSFRSTLYPHVCGSSLNCDPNRRCNRVLASYAILPPLRGSGSTAGFGQRHSFDHGS